MILIRISFECGTCYSAAENLEEANKKVTSIIEKMRIDFCEDAVTEVYFSTGEFLYAGCCAFGA